MTNLLDTLRATVGPAHVLAEINRGFLPIFRQTGQPVFATVFCGVIDTELQCILYANAGHPPPFHVRQDTGTVVPLALESPEPAAGLVDDFAYTRGVVPFGVGDKLICFTDGVVEAADASGEYFGQERLCNLALHFGHRPGDELIEKIVAAVRGFSGREQFDDDLCLLAIESTGKTCPMMVLNWEI